MLKRFLKEFQSDEYKDMFVYHRSIPESEAEFTAMDDSFDSSLKTALHKTGITSLYSHQAEAIELVRQGKNPVTITPTASGKTLTYNIPVIEYFLRQGEGHALYLFPLKALEQDQLRQFDEINALLPADKSITAAVYDGDTPSSIRAKIRSNYPRILITNPEMLHLAVSGYHKGWSKFLKNLRFVVIDELHTYKGIFGSHMAQLFRRLNRLCAHYGSQPQFIASSATIANPVELAENLTAKPFVLVEKSGAPSPKRHYIFLSPEISAYTVASRLFRLGVSYGLKTIAFTKARKITELIYKWILEAEPQLENRITAYRAGFLPEERREIEAQLSSGKLAGVISTSALELGIDIGSLDLCILVGYPGTISATYQRGGRVGRKEESVVLLIAQQNALDQYFMRNPEDFFDRSYEAAVVDSGNKHILKEHIVCAAAEIPISEADIYYPPSKYPELFDQLVYEGLLQQSADGTRWFSRRKNPQREVNLRSIGAIYTITDNSGKIIGSISGANIYGECHPGGVYLHRGRQYLVTDLDLQNKNVTVRPADVPYYTNVQSQKDTAIISDESQRRSSNFILHKGEIKVTEWVTGYQKRRMHTQELMGTFPLDLPSQSYQTVGCWIEVDQQARMWCESQGFDFMGGLHGTEHALLALTPLFALCDRADMGGISFVEHLEVKGPAIFIYDGYPGGVGLSDRIYTVFEKLLERCLNLVKECPCEDGCPSCIHSPKCGSGNYPLDKNAVIGLLERFTGKGDFKVEEVPAMKPKPAVIRPAIKQENTQNIIFFDIETQLSADDVGGCQNIDKMKLAAAVTLELNTRKFRLYYEEEAADLIADLKKADLVVGFNLLGFDYKVLRFYGLTDFSGIRTLDILEEIQKRIGRRIKLDAVAGATLNMNKSGDGLQSLEWFKQGRMDLVVKYCQQDVEIVRDLYLFGKEKGFLLYEDKMKGTMRIPVKW